MKEYHKIQTVFLRDPETKFKTLLEGQWAKPEFAYLADNEWEFAEKVDGTNIRVMWTGGAPRFSGKTDDAQMPPFLLRKLQERFTESDMREAFPDAPNEIGMAPNVCLYGAKIQKGGGRYIPDGCDFILFDVTVGDWWLESDAVTDIANKLGISVVPIIGNGKLREGIEIARTGFKSRIAIDGSLDAEGLVMRPKVQMFDRKGDRVIAKIKARDFAPVAPELRG